MVLFLDPKLPNKSAVRFVLWWISLNISFISPFWVGICMGGTLRTQNFVLWWNSLNKIVISPYFPCNLKMKLRLEVLFKKFHPRINMTTLFLTKLYLLNTIKPFSGHENRSLTKSQKAFTRGVPWTSKFWVCRKSSWLKRLR
jgi:hypothetical protein